MFRTPIILYSFRQAGRSARFVHLTALSRYLKLEIRNPKLETNS